MDRINDMKIVEQSGKNIIVVATYVDGAPRLVK